MVSFPKYESYQSTEEDWLGDIPQHWQLLRTKSIFRLVAEPAPNNNDEELLSVYSDIGVKPRRELEERGNKASTTDGYWLVKKGDIIVNKLLAWMGAIGLSEYDRVTSPAYDILRAYKPINSKFYHYLFRNPICINKLKKHSKGIMEMRLRLYFDEFGNIKIPYPPLEDQNRIVKFLDRKTAEIDQAIEQKQRLIKLLKEQKAILIDRSVTKGLNPNVRMRDSGIELIDKIPGHWKVARLKTLMKKMDQGWSPQCFNYPADDDKWGVLKVGCVNGYQFSPNENKVLPPNLKPIQDLELKHKDILISRANTLELVGSAACALNPREKLMISDKIFRVLVHETEVIPEYFILLLQVKIARRQIESGANGASSSMQNIGRNVIRNLWMPIPPIKEQREILDFVTDFNEQQQQLVISIVRESHALRELKQIIIAQSVTGKIKICSSY